MKSNTTKVLKLQMLALAGVVYFVNALITFSLTGFDEYKVLFSGANFYSAFTMGLIFALASLYGYTHTSNRTAMQMFSFAYMLPLTGTCTITMVALYAIHKVMGNSLMLWFVMMVSAALLALSFGMFWKAADQDNHVTP